MTVLAMFCLLLFGALVARFFAIGDASLLLSRFFILALGACIGGMYSLALGSLTAFFDASDSRHFANIAVMSGVAGAVLLPFTFGQISNVAGLEPAAGFVLFLLTGMFAGAALLLYASTKPQLTNTSI